MKFEESLDIGSRDGGEVVLLLARKSIFFDEVYVFFLWTAVRSIIYNGYLPFSWTQSNCLVFPVVDVLEKCI